MTNAPGHHNHNSRNISRPGNLVVNPAVSFLLYSHIGSLRHFPEIVFLQSSGKCPVFSERLKVCRLRILTVKSRCPRFDPVKGIFLRKKHWPSSSSLRCSSLKSQDVKASCVCETDTVILTALNLKILTPLHVFLSPVPESPQLSSPLFTGEHGQANIDLGPDCYSRLCAEPLDGEGERPVSLVSTLSSDSSRDSRSLFGSTIALPSSTTPPIQCGEDIDLELSPAEGSGGQAGDQSPTLTSSRGHWQDRPEPKVISNQRNNNNAASNRKASADRPHLPAPPVVTDAMAPNPKLTYVDRVVMEIIETERMYVKDLRSIVEVSGCQGLADCTQIELSLYSCHFSLSAEHSL